MHAAGADRPRWSLLGVHSSRMDMATRDAAQDESLGLNCAWYADVLMTLDELRSLARAKLRSVGLAPDHADAVAEVARHP